MESRRGATPTDLVPTLRVGTRTKNAKTSDTWSGTKQLGVEGAATFGNGVATDANGNVFVAGYTRGPLDGNALMGIRDFFVTKYDANGVKQ